MRKPAITLLAASSILCVGHASAAILLSTNFNSTTKTNATKTVSNITWTTSDLTLASPNLVFSGSATGFISPGGSPNNTVQVAGNVENTGPWSTKFTITPTATLDLDDFTLMYRAINSTGANQTNQKDANITLRIYEGADLTGTLLGTFNDIIVDPGTSAGGNEANWDTANIDLSTLGALTSGQAYTFELTTSSNTTTGGNNWAIDDLTLNGVPEPGAALLGGIGMLALLRRRR